jgi:hypothetical protein
LIEEMLSWLPADTESVIAASGPFVMPERREGSNGTQVSETSEHEVQDTFRELPLALFGVKKGLLDKYLKDEQIIEAIEGSRDFRPPSGLGEARFQGCAIAFFAGDISARANSFLKDSSQAILRTEQIEGHEVAVFEEKLEEDTWTTYVAFPRSNIAIAATSEEYLREVLARINGKHRERALPGTLPEWKHVDVHAGVWSVRHYDKKLAATDPTSSFSRLTGTKPDLQAVGLTFSFTPDKSKTATVTFLSGDENSLQNIPKNLFSDREPGVRELNARYRQAEPGALEGSYDLEHIESAEYFVFVLEALLGHAIYL